MYGDFSCMKVITGNSPGPNDHHGCPFRHFAPEVLRQRLRSMLPSSMLVLGHEALEQLDKGLAEVLELVKGTHYQVACTRYFEIQQDVKAVAAGISEDGGTQVAVQTITH